MASGAPLSNRLHPADSIRRHRACAADLRERSLREALSEQRVQITRELHDIVGHAAIRIIAAGDALLAPSVTRKLIREFARQAPVPPRPALDVLTDREQDVLALVARGLSNAEIATVLFITLATVKVHVSRLLAARDRAQLIVIAYESGFVTPA